MSDGMHGRKKVRTTEELQQARKEREAVKIKEYSALVKECFEKKSEKQYDAAALSLTTRILYQNPDYYTVWNYRRLILREGNFKDATPNAIQASLKSELDFFMQLIPINPKSYWMWNHRRWCLEAMPKPAWERELALVDKMLEMDARNFHGWDYRRYVISHLARDPGTTDTQALRTNPTVARSEFDFTTRKVSQNFSNYSAWHNRSKLLPIVVDALEGENARNEVAEKELELIKAAIYTDPDDSSVWLYRWWLIGREIIPISLLGAHLTQTSPTTTILLAFDDEIGMLNPFTVLSSDAQPLAGSWRSLGIGNNVSGNLGERRYGFVWEFRAEGSGEAAEIVVRKGDLVASRSERAWCREEMRVRVRPGNRVGEVEVREEEVKGATWYTLDRTELLRKEVEDVRALLELEPESKWALQTLSHFLTELRRLRPADPSNTQVEDEVVTILERLQTIDPDRAKRYEDWRTQLIFERATRHLVKSVGAHGEVIFADEQLDTLDLSNLGLTYIPTPSLLLHIPRINLKGNRLTIAHAVKTLEALPLVKVEWEGNLFTKDELDAVERG